MLGRIVRTVTDKPKEEEGAWGLTPDNQETPEPVAAEDHVAADDPVETTAESAPDENDPEYWDEEWDEAQELRNELARAQADLKNHQDRKRKDLDASYEAGRREVIESLIPVLDSIAGAREHGDLTDENPLTPVVKNLSRVLEAQGLGVIGTPGEEFDPKLHDAIKVEYSSEVDRPEVLEVYQQGYGTPDRLLRSAKVSVVKYREESQEEQGSAS